MIFPKYLLSIALLSKVAFAIIPNVPPPPAEGFDSTTKHDEPGPLSLPNLLNIDKISTLESNWKTFGNIKLDTGRLLIDATEDGFGSIWSIPSLPDTAKEWTVELVFRSTGTAQDLQFFNTNGLSLFLVDEKNTLTINKEHNQNFGGPLNYDGFQFLINNKDIKGLKIFNSDRSKAITNELTGTIGHCSFNFLDSSVPFTLRISYSAVKAWFKVQVDNNLCFKTDQIQIPTNINDFKLGITGSSQSNEIFEILKFNVYDHLIGDAIDDHGLLSDGQVVAYETVTKGSDEEEEIATPGVIRESLMEKSRKLVEDQLKKEGHISSSSDYDTILNEILINLQNIQARISTLDKNEDYDIKQLDTSLGKVTNILVQQHEVLGKLSSSIETFQTSITEQFSQMLGAISKLNEKVIGEVREQHYGMEEISKKVDLLMNNHKELTYQYEKSSTDSSNTTAELSKYYLDATIRWVLVPLLIVAIVLIVVLNKLRKEVKHSKML
ncbi:concanavalin A-like lectin/glucanase domain-containing protein [Scheffersomyces coipomensis]|uniref:concanavalin A-like lectin/glucanase domain-containing protein n=1 Tax=Scheffersomyces coipomensis TaxID=1788519 RepID=UPI00315DE802